MIKRTHPGSFALEATGVDGEEKSSYRLAVVPMELVFMEFMAVAAVPPIEPAIRVGIRIAVNVRIIVGAVIRTVICVARIISRRDAHAYSKSNCCICFRCCRERQHTG